MFMRLLRKVFGRIHLGLVRQIETRDFTIYVANVDGFNSVIVTANEVVSR